MTNDQLLTWLRQRLPQLEPGQLPDPTIDLNDPNLNLKDRDTLRQVVHAGLTVLAETSPSPTTPAAPPPTASTNSAPPTAASAAAASSAPNISRPSNDPSESSGSRPRSTPRRMCASPTPVSTATSCPESTSTATLST